MEFKEQPDIVALVAAAQRQDATAFDGLYAHYAKALYRYLYARCGDPELAEELLGELWLFVVERLPGFRIPPQGGDLAFSGWLYQIARMRLLEHFRKNKRQQAPLDESIPADTPELDEALQQTEEHAALHDALGTLTDEQREVVLLRYFERRSSAEVATLTGRTEGAVKALQHRAIASLARALRLNDRTRIPRRGF